MPNYLQAMAGRLGRGMGIDPRRRFAQQLMAQGVDTSPAHLGTGIGRLGKALAAAYMMRQSQGQEADAMKWLTAEQPDRFRQPTRAEALATSQPLRELEIASDVGQPGGLVERLKALSNPDGLIVGEQQEPLGLDPLSGPQADQGTTRERTLSQWSPAITADVVERVMQGTRGTLSPNYKFRSAINETDIERQGREIYEGFPEEFKKNPTDAELDRLLAGPGEPVPEQLAPTGLPSGVAPIGDDQIQEETFTKEPPRDYAQELKRGMEAYQGAKANQISDPRTRMEWLRESARGMEGNPFVSRMLQNLMFAEIARGDEEKLYQRGRKDTLADAATKRKQAIEDRKFGKRPTRPKRSATPGMVYDETWNPETGTWDRGEDYDPKLRSEAAQKQFVEGKEAGKTTWTIGVDSAGNPVQRSSQGKEIPVAKAPVSKAVEVVDKEFGKFYAKHFATGGVHDAIKSLDQLDSVIRRLDAVAGGTSDENLTGPVIGLRPNWLSSMVNPEQVDTQNMIEEVVQRNLRVVLGAQFTEREGERLIARAYNPQLGEAENAVRVQRLVNAMRNTLNSQMKAADYYEKNNTLAGWKGTHTLSVADLEKIIDGDESQLTTGEFGNVKFSNVRTQDSRVGDKLSPDKKKRLEELRRKARGQ